MSQQKKNLLSESKTLLVEELPTPEVTQPVATVADRKNEDDLEELPF